MDVKEENICRICLKVAITDFHIIDENIRKMFQTLLLNINLDISKDPIICEDCAEVVEKCFKFKSLCIDTEHISFFAIDKNGATLELKDVYRDKKDVENVDNFTCRFCSNRLSGSNFVLLENLMNDITFAAMLQVFMPEKDYDIKVPIICTTCKLDLECYIKFVTNCFDVEEKITKYLQNEGIHFSVQVKLSKILHYLFKNNSEIDYTLTYAIKQEVDALEPGETAYEVYGVDSIKSEEKFDIKDEDFNFPSCETLSEPCRQITNQTVITKNIFKCTVCTYQTKQKGTLTTHMLTHKDVTEVEMYKCSLCTYETKYKGNLRKHMLIHKDVTDAQMYKCSMCTYQAKQKRYLTNHMIMHKDMAEMEMYKCAMCTYETRHKGSLKIHMLIHKDVTDVQMYKCAMCSYETKRKNGLKYHMTLHKTIVEMEMYKCSNCTYEAKQKRYLDSHMLIHKNITEVKMNKCSMCSFETKHKGYLKKHIKLVHRDIPEVEMNKCSVCSFETKHKDYIKTHMKLIHKDIEGVEML